MKHLHNAELSETAAYRYAVGFMFKAAEIFKKGILSFISHITEFLMAVSLIGMATAANAFDDNAISYTVAILFITILAVLLASLIKIKILESKADEDGGEE